MTSCLDERIAFRVQRKSGTWKEIDPPVPGLEGPLADSHAHLSMLEAPERALARAGAWGVDYLCCISDITDDANQVYGQLHQWTTGAQDLLNNWAEQGVALSTDLPQVDVACGCHPHNAQAYSDEIEQALLTHLDDPRTCCLGEIGLDYYYDYSPRDIQRDVFARQVQLAHSLHMPVSLHIRDAHDDAIAIMDEQGYPQAGTILHCFTLDAEEVKRWLDRGCYIAIGGAVTFNKLDDLRDAARVIPDDRLLFETDAPFMAPVPLRGTECTPAHLIFTAAALTHERGVEPGDARKAFLERVHTNTLEVLGKDV